MCSCFGQYDFELSEEMESKKEIPKPYPIQEEKNKDSDIQDDAPIHITYTSHESSDPVFRIRKIGKGDHATRIVLAYK